MNSSWGSRLNPERWLLWLAGNIRVFCRCRPLSQAEMAVNAASVMEFEAASNGDIVVRNGTAGKKLFKFDRVFSPQDDQCKSGNEPASGLPLLVWSAARTRRS